MLVPAWTACPRWPVEILQVGLGAIVGAKLLLLSRQRLLEVFHRSCDVFRRPTPCRAGMVDAASRPGRLRYRSQLLWCPKRRCMAKLARAQSVRARGGSQSRSCL